MYVCETPWKLELRPLSSTSTYTYGVIIGVMVVLELYLNVVNAQSFWEYTKQNPFILGLLYLFLAFLFSHMA